MRLALIVVASFGLVASAAYAQPSSDPLLAHIDAKASQPLTPVAADHAPGSCHVRFASNGMQLPDPACTPGAINPTITIQVLRDPAFRTTMVRDDLTSAAAKRKTYAWYGITPPKNNATGPNQLCELDHLISLDLGGSDALENVWPQCQAPGAAAVPVGQREFKVKDAHAELGLMKKVHDGEITDLSDMQHRIADDWTQFIVEPTKSSADDSDPRVLKTAMVTADTCDHLACELNFGALADGRMTVSLSKAGKTVIGPLDLGPLQWTASTLPIKHTGFNDLVGAIYKLSEQGR